MVKRADKKLLRISEVAQKAGVLSSTIRYYTDMGIILAGGETPGGHRLYDEEATLSAIRKIQFLNKQGLTIEQIKKDLTSSYGKKKILVIDDEPEVGELVLGLAENNFPSVEVKTVYNGFAAGRILNEFLPDMIILDIMLPGVNGFEVCKQIKSSELHKNVKILAITGYDSPENREKMLACGASDFLAKPMDLTVLKKKIISFLGVEEQTAVAAHAQGHNH